MIPEYFFRSTVFNICYYLLIALSCIILLPTLILPRKYFLGVVYYFVKTTAFFERIILGLNYEIRGIENLPKDKNFIIAAKHQSAYETTKLHILFKDPAIVLKQELLKLPLWGWYLAKSDVIAIDRSTPKKAIESLKSEAQRVSAQNRPIIIFPQGTRVSAQTTPKERPYKVGVVRVQEATQLPIVPLALNTATFYPRNAWIKKPGTVIFEFLKPIEYIADTKPDETLKKIETALEERSNALRDESLEIISNKRTLGYIPFIVTILLLTIGWSLNWMIAANLTKTAALQALHDVRTSQIFKNTQISEVKISGFPFKMELSINSAILETHFGKIDMRLLSAKSWPILGMPIDIKTHKIELYQYNWSAPLNFDSFRANVKYSQPELKINFAELIHESSKAEISGTLTEGAVNKEPQINLNIAIYDHDNFLKVLERKNIIKNKARMLTSIALNALKTDNAARTTLTSQKNKIYLGLIKIYEFPTNDYSGTSQREIIKDIRRRPNHIINGRNKEPFEQEKSFEKLDEYRLYKREE